MKTIINTFIVMGLSIFVFAQKPPIDLQGYTYQQTIKPPFQKKLKINEIMLSQNEEYVIVNYGNKPTFIVFFKIKTFEKVIEFKLPSWVEFSGAYFDNSNENMYIKTERFSSSYYRLNLTSNKIDTIQCQNAPKKCIQSDISQDIKELFTSDKTYYISIHPAYNSQLIIYKKDDSK